ncbi:retrotransposon protein, putative [Candida dubliniensis CD36]|uniref:Retrotransposon protein, putative n=1 Tax=Candida dubliniensis (strain CD36 / ATCC MYA-646 / CBS 7987 / NCPF 3949 / NRRL Y-17841) TaxID=573826 RepID=B9WDZ4_CANDC|nr:retrotransposon protein, putative [Candida dubliniensis CD36]CAX42904.1 retrotransposon protein, putative [Candida dubliniensis CD36]
MSNNSESNASNDAQGENNPLSPINPITTLGQDNPTTVQDDDPTMVGNTLNLTQTDQQVNELLSQRLPKMMADQFGPMVNEQLHPMMDKLFEAHLPKYISTIENHVKAMYFDTATTRIIDTLKPFIQETVNQAVRPRFPGSFSEPANVLSNKNNISASPPPTQTNNPGSQPNADLENPTNEALDHPESVAADTIPIQSPQDVGASANHQQDSNGTESVNSTMPHPPSSVPSIDTTNPLKSPTHINSPNPSHQSTYSMVNSMNTHVTSQPSTDQFVNNSPPFGSGKFFEVRKRISAIDAECQDLKVKITDINIIEKKLPYIYNPSLSKESLFIERLDLIESIPDIERTKEEKESLKKSNHKEYPTTTSIKTTHDTLLYVKELLFYKAKYSIPDKLLKGAFVLACNNPKDNDLKRACDLAIIPHNTNPNFNGINYGIIIDLLYDTEPAIVAESVLDSVNNYLQNEKNAIMLVAQIDFAITSNINNITPSIWYQIYCSLWNKQKPLMTNLTKTIDNPKVSATLESIQFYKSSAITSNPEFQKIDFHEVWKIVSEQLRHIAKYHSDTTSSSTPQSNNQKATNSNDKNPNTKGKSPCTCCGKRNHSAQACFTLKQLIKNEKVKFSDNIFYKMDGTTPYELSPSEYLLKKYRTDFPAPPKSNTENKPKESTSNDSNSNARPHSTV